MWIVFSLLGVSLDRINGNGDVWWQLAKENNDKAYPRPIIFDCDHCDGLELYDLTITNSPKFHVYIGRSSSCVMRACFMNLVIRRASVDDNT